LNLRITANLNGYHCRRGSGGRGFMGGAGETELQLQRRRSLYKYLSLKSILILICCRLYFILFLCEWWLYPSA
jgi:hypothetical protein